MKTVLVLEGLRFLPINGDQCLKVEILFHPFRRSNRLDRSGGDGGRLINLTLRFKEAWFSTIGENCGSTMQCKAVIVAVEKRLLLLNVADEVSGMSRLQAVHAKR